MSNCEPGCPPQQPGPAGPRGPAGAQGPPGPTGPAGPAGTFCVQDEGVLVACEPILNFEGAGVSVVDDPGGTRVTVTIPGGAAACWDCDGSVTRLSDVTDTVAIGAAVMSGAGEKVRIVGTLRNEGEVHINSATPVLRLGLAPGSGAGSAASAGDIRMRNGSPVTIQARNNADTANFILVSWDSATVTNIFGEGGTTHTWLHSFNDTSLLTNGSIRLSVTSTLCTIVPPTLQLATSDTDFDITHNTQSIFGIDAAAGVRNLAIFAAASTNFQSGNRILFISDRTAAPTGNPAAGGYLYSNAGAGTWRGSGGTITAFGPT